MHWVGKRETDLYTQQTEECTMKSGLALLLASGLVAAATMAQVPGGITELAASQAYNTNLVKKEDLPKSYQELADPKWKGRLGIESKDDEWFYARHRR
jgi:hypothetical protein